ncbi:alpha/beta hydrolase [Colwelliaceae bacterium 6471]
MQILWSVILSFCAMLTTVAAAAHSPSDMQVSSGKLEVYQQFESAYVQARTVRVWLPNGYSNQQKYDVLYMHDGQMLFDAKTTWNKQEWQIDEVASELIQTQKTRPFIVVGIDNGGELRHSEYFPQKAINYIVTNDNNKHHPLFKETLKADHYLKFMVQELKPFIDKHYSVHSDKEHTFILGSSMGGLISMYAISEYPEIFGGAACISTHWPGIDPDTTLPVAQAFYTYMQGHLPSPTSHKLYFDHGTKTLDKYYPPLQAQADKVIKVKGYTDKNWLTLQFDGADHSEKSWAARLDQPLLFLLGNRN